MKKIFTFSLIVASFCCHGQKTDFEFDHYNTSSGLSDNFVTSIFKDHDGYIWIGTMDGLNRFDGLKFRIYKTSDQDTHSITNNTILGIVEDEFNYLWISTAKGLCRYDKRTDAFETIIRTAAGQKFARSINSNVTKDRMGRICFASADKIYQINPSTLGISAISFPEFVQRGLLNYMVYSDRAGRLWICNGGNLFGSQPHSTALKYYLGLSAKEGARPLFCHNIMQMTNGDIIAGTGGDGLFRYDPTSDRFLPVVPGFDNRSQVYTYAEDSTATLGHFLWVGSYPEGAFIYQYRTGKQIRLNADLQNTHHFNNEVCNAVFKDSQTGNVWLGTQSGLEVYIPDHFFFKRRFLTTDVGAANRFLVTSIRPAKDYQSYYLGTLLNGVLKWDQRNDSITPLNKTAQVVRDMVIDDKKNRLCIATRKGVQLYDLVTGQTFFRPVIFSPADKSACVNSMFNDGSHLWLATSSGELIQTDFNLSAKKYFRLPGDPARLISKGGIVKITGDGHNRLWVCASGSGIYYYDYTDRSVHLFHYDSAGVNLDSENIRTVFVDSKRRLWVGGDGFVLAFNNRGQLLRDLNINAVARNKEFMVTSIIQDRQNRFWISTTDKLYLFDETKKGSSSWQQYQKTDGLSSDMMTPAAFSGQNDRIVFGFKNSVSFATVSAGVSSHSLPHALIDLVEVNGKTRQLEGDSVTLTPGERSLVVDFSVINYYKPGNNTYRFKLTGPESQSGYLKTPEFRLSNMRSGSYHLTFSAAGIDGDWSKPVTLIIVVKPVFWSTAWFKIVCIGLLLCIAGAFYYNKISNLKQLMRIREQIAKDIHDDVGSTLSTISIYSQILKDRLKEERSALTPHIEKLSTNCRNLMLSLQEVIWAMQTNNDSVEDLAAKMREFACKVLEMSNISFRLYESDNIKHIRLSLMQKRNLYIIFKESINNALKYARCTEINVLLLGSNGNIEVVIKDNGIGFDMEEVRTGNGLYNIKHRAEAINAMIHVDSKINTGTSVRLVLANKKRLKL